MSPGSSSGPRGGIFRTVMRSPEGQEFPQYTALAMHKDEEDSRRHAQMGFHDGWGKALEQLVEVAKKMPAE